MSVSHEQAARYAARKAELYAQRKEGHLCVQCGAQDDRTLSGKCMCERCSEANKRRMRSKSRQEYQRDTYKMLKKHHFCITCRKQDAFTLAGRAQCAECSQRANENRRKMLRNPQRKEHRLNQSRQWREKMIAERRCVECGRKLPTNWEKRRCPNCNAAANQNALEKARASGVRSKEDAISHGLCCLCCKRPVIAGKKMCQSCYDGTLKRLEKARPKVPDAEHPWRKLRFGMKTERGDAT